MGMWKTLLNKQNFLDFLWIVLMCFLLVWLHQSVFSALQQLYPDGMIINSALFFSTIPLLTAFVIAFIYFRLYTEFKANSLAFKLMFFLNFILSVILIIGIVLLKSSIFLIYPAGSGMIAVVVKMYTGTILKV